MALMVGLGACGPSKPAEDPEELLSDIDVVVSEIVPTVATATWQSETTDGFVLTCPADCAAWTRTLAESDGQGGYTAVIFGQKPSSSFSLRVGGLDGETEVASDAVTVETGDLPSDFPDQTVVLDEVEERLGLLAVAVVSQQSWAAILDEDGDVVWWYANPEPELITTRVLRSVDGRSVLFNAVSTADVHDVGTLSILRVAYDGTLVETIPTEEGHHDFAELADGTLAWLAFDARMIDGDRIRGDKLVERSPDGVNTDLWSAWDWYNYEDFLDVPTGTTFVHANTLRYDEVRDQWWVGLFNASQIDRIDRQTGEIAARILGEDSDYALSSGRSTVGQHGFSILDDGFVVHDNRDSTGTPSRAVQYRIDEAAGTMEQVWEYVSAGEYRVLGLGDALRLGDGDTVVIWSSAGEINRVSEEGTLNWQINLDVGAAYGYGQWSLDTQVWPWPSNQEPG